MSDAEYSPPGRVGAATKLIPKLVTTLLAAVLTASTAFATDSRTAYLIRSVGGEAGIPKLTWLSETAQLETESTEDGTKIVARFQGLYPGGEWTLIHGKTFLRQPQGSPEFMLQVEIENEMQSVSLTAVGPDGTVRKADLQIQAPGLAEFQKLLSQLQDPWRFETGLGFRADQYQQPAYLPYSGPSLTLSQSLRYRLTKRLHARIEAALTALPLTTSNGTSFRFFGADASIRYWLTPEYSLWRLAVVGGYAYRTMFVSGAEEGYHDVGSPELFPLLEYELRNGQSFSIYAKFLPVSGVTLSNHEFATGAAFRMPITVSLLKELGVALDYSNITLNIAPGEISSRALTFRLLLDW